MAGIDFPSNDSNANQPVSWLTVDVENTIDRLESAYQDMNSGRSTLLDPQLTQRAIFMLTDPTVKACAQQQEEAHLGSQSRGASASSGGAGGDRYTAPDFS